VGISIDGLRATHDRFRRLQGAFDASMHGIRLCQQHGIKVGLRFTLTQDNAAELPAILDLMEEMDIDKFYLSHLNYAGRGNRNRKDDVVHQLTRQTMDMLFERCWAGIQAGRPREFVTGNNDADGVYLLFWVQKHFPEQAAAMRARLAQWGGNASGLWIANIDNLGNVHPDTFWWDYHLGNVRERNFSEIWPDTTDPLMAGFKQQPRPVTGRCGECNYLDICGGNTRVRAWSLTGDPWAEDPACYLDDAEIGASGDHERLRVTPYKRTIRIKQA
jgi:radical SAM protein with 4Fe4S-binding SPASM domain